MREIVAAVCVDTEKSKSTTEENSKCFIALIVMFSLLSISVFTNIGLTVGVLRIKGKSSCMKGNSFNLH